MLCGKSLSFLPYFYIWLCQSSDKGQDFSYNLLRNLLNKLVLIEESSHQLDKTFQCGLN